MTSDLDRLLALHNLASDKAQKEYQLLYEKLNLQLEESKCHDELRIIIESLKQNQKSQEDIVKMQKYDELKQMIDSGQMQLATGSEMRVLIQNTEELATLKEKIDRIYEIVYQARMIKSHMDRIKDIKELLEQSKK